MIASIYPVLEQPIVGFEESRASGTALARVIEAHSALSPLMDFYSVDPTEVALAVGMVYPYEEDGIEDLKDIDLGQPEWFEPGPALAAARAGLASVRKDPHSIAAAIYDPGLRAEDVIADLEAIEQALLLAQQHETRFHFAMDEESNSVKGH